MHELAAAMHKNYLAALANITVLGPAGEAARVGPWLLLDAGDDFDYFNIAAVAADPIVDPGDAVETAIRWFGAREKPFRFVFRDDADRALVAAAQRLGFATAESEPAMLLPAFPQAFSVGNAPRIQRVTDEPAADIYAGVEPEDSGSLDVRKAISRRALRLPGCSLFLGYEGETPVARAMGLCTGEMAGIYNVYVGERHRRRGYGEGITEAVLEDARLSGAASACLTASDLGYPLYLRMGFEPVFRYVSMWRSG